MILFGFRGKFESARLLRTSRIFEGIIFCESKLVSSDVIADMVSLEWRMLIALVSKVPLDINFVLLMVVGKCCQIAAGLWWPHRGFKERDVQ